MRRDLETLPGINDLRTSIATKMASFEIPKDQREGLEAKLDEFEKDNEHMKDWSFDEGVGPIPKPQ